MKNKAKFITLLLLLVMVALIAISGTYSKYTSEFSGEDTATVAKWSIEVNGTDITTANSTVSFGLFDTILDSNGTDTEEDISGTNKIAPGTSGKFNLQVTNNSEVTAQYSISFALSNTSIPIVFSTDGQTYSDSLSNITTTAIEIGETKTQTVYWKWTFEDDTGATKDAADTALDTSDTLDTVTVTTTITVEQVD